MSNDRVDNLVQQLHEGLQKTLEAYQSTDQDLQKGFSQK